MTSVRFTLGFGLCIITMLMVGCGGGDETAPTASNSSDSTAGEQSSSAGASTQPEGNSSETQKSVPPPPASIGGNEQMEMPKEGTPLWYLLEIRKLRGQPAPETTDLAEMRKYRYERNEKFIELATQTISQTHSNPEMSEAFNLAVQELMEARLQNALQGSEEDIALLYEEVDMFIQRDANSPSAMTASHTLVRFAHTNAMRYAAQEPKWITEFSRKARQFAGSFPEEKAKSLPLLSAAALTAEMHGQQSEAIACHTLLAEKFTDSPQGKFSVGVLRRLNLEGQKLEFAGPTLEGGFLNLEDYGDRVVLIAFWESDDEKFAAQLPELKTLYEKYNKFGFEIIGVCMDEEEGALNSWLEEQGVGWRQIFFVNKEERSWRNPVAQYYGVRKIPTLWLVDHNGVVQEADVNVDSLEELLRVQLLGLREKLKSAAIDAPEANE
jgi:hypothetical protein